MPMTNNLVELRDVYKIYGEGLESEVRALDGVSLSIRKGSSWRWWASPAPASPP